MAKISNLQNGSYLIKLDVGCIAFFGFTEYDFAIWQKYSESGQPKKFLYL